MSPVADFLADPRAVLWACFVGPFAARLFVAWTVWLRVHGVLPAQQNLPPRRTKNDFPPPNDPVVAGAVLALAAMIAAVLSGPVSSGVVQVSNDPILWPALFAVTTILSVSYTLGRLRADDRRAREVILRGDLTSGKSSADRGPR